MELHEFEALEDWIKALIDERISDRFGRNSLSETIRTSELRRDVLEAFLIQ